ncbi:hypothetical protein L207DRAFT_609415 [Hyaloscypha variabilis F]|uniref:Uncharacterized protein n=1 Tax=Hyaloscypha variabilis (strain UAMH 11265 / GT02V1 / F) TaxID=1149755 RepID=A0A2J6R2Q6_HYAVF|nr:hypothetical protein L207DRAFT_609415 [Hyaloscypha variabilis F]
MAMSQPQSSSSTPDGYEKQIRLPRHQAETFTRFACLVLNHLQDNLQPLPGHAVDIFNVPERKDFRLYETRLSPDSPAVKQVGLGSLENMSEIRVEIIVWKKVTYRKKSYNIECVAEAYEVDGTAAGGKKPMSVEGKVLEVVMTVGWSVGEQDFSGDYDAFNFRDILKKLRKSSERNWNMWGERRTVEEEREIDREEANVFKTVAPCCVRRMVFLRMPNGVLAMTDRFAVARL